MRKYSYTENGFTFERIDRATARRAYINGLSVVACPVNLRPGVIPLFISRSNMWTDSQAKHQPPPHLKQ